MTPAALLERPAGFTDAVRSEWTKITSLRSTAYTLIATVVIGVGFGILFSLGGARGHATMTPEEQAAFDPTAVSLRCYLLAQLAIAVLGVLVVTSEYATGMIRTSLTTVPRRRRLLAAKAAAFAGVGLVTGQVVALTSFVVGQAILSGQASHATLNQPGVLRAVLGGGLYLAAVGLAGIAVGVLVRATAGAVTIMMASTLLVPMFTPILPEQVARAVGTYWPTMAGGRIVTVVHDPNLLSPWAGFGVLVAAVAAALVAAFVVFQRRDA